MTTFVDFNGLVALFMRPYDSGFQTDFITPRGGLHERLMHQQPGHSVVFAYLIFYLLHEPVSLVRRLLLRPLM